MNLSYLYATAAIVLWASLALTSARLAHLPPFFVLAIAFIVGGLPALWWPRRAFPPLRGLALGVAGYYGYHFFLFTALKLAPPVEANLINYLWPMLLVLMTPLFFRDFQLTRFHLLGAVIAFAGCVLLLQRENTAQGGEVWWGYTCAVGAALTWPTYSLAKKLLPPTPTLTIAGTCLVTGVLCGLTHWVGEAAATPVGVDWYWLIWLGVGPFGLAFYLWDLAIAGGDPRVVGAISYLTPVLSTVGLVSVAGLAPPWTTWVALVLISLGAAVGAWRSRSV